MLYLIGTGLNEKGISKEGLEAIEKCKKVYLEGYTVDFPYDIKKLGIGVIKLGRSEVESQKLVKEAKKEDIALLVYGCPLFATTHTTLIMDAKKAEIPVKIIYAASIFDAVAQTGLQLYKFGKITSMPKWQKSFEPDSFMDIFKDNESIKAHTLILTDIGLEFKEALEQLEKSADRKKMKIEKIIVCSKMGTEEGKIYYDSLENLREEKISLPFCIIIPSEMHFFEKEALESVAEK